MIKEKFDTLVLELSQEDKNAILTFVLESQILEYGIRRALLELPVSHKIDKEKIKDKTLGAMISDLERSKDEYLVSIAKSVREFNDLRVEIIHHLVDTDLSSKELMNEIRESIQLSREIQKEIERMFTYLFKDVMGFSDEYGVVF